MGLRERLVASVTDVRQRGQRLVQLNLELLSAELKQKGQQFGAAVALFVGAGVLALYAVGFALATIAVALALVLPLWLSLLIVTALLVLLVVVLVLAGRGQVRRATAPGQVTAVNEARKTADLMKTNVRDTVAGVRARARGRRPAGASGAAPPALVPVVGRPPSAAAPPPSGGAAPPPSAAEPSDAGPAGPTPTPPSPDTGGEDS